MKSALRAARTAANPPLRTSIRGHSELRSHFLELVARQRTPDLPDGPHK